MQKTIENSLKYVEYLLILELLLQADFMWGLCVNTMQFFINLLTTCDLKFLASPMSYALISRPAPIPKVYGKRSPNWRSKQIKAQNIGGGPMAIIGQEVY